MTNSIYDLHDKAFLNVSAYVIMKDGERVATIAFKFPKDGAGRLYAYVHFIGAEMVRDYAGGYGYDKRTAAVQHAAAKIPPYRNGEEHISEHYRLHAEKINEGIQAFQNALKDIGGQDWNDALRVAGYTVLQAV